MNNLTVVQQKSSDKLWMNEAGQAIPYDRVTSAERLHERKLSPLAKERIALRKAMAAHKNKCFEIGRELYDAFLNENGGVNLKSKGKGNVTRYNFDRTIKIEIQVNEAIVFDEGMLDLAKNLLDEILSDGLQGAKEFVKPIVMEAFESRGGKMDVKKVLGLRRHSDKVSDPRYKDAMSYIDKAIRRPSSKEYFSLYIKDESGEYVDVHLNFANI
jgi:hypothetical protein